MKTEITKSEYEYFCDSKKHDNVIRCVCEHGSPICPICATVMTYGRYGTRNVVTKGYTHIIDERGMHKVES